MYINFIDIYVCAWSINIVSVYINVQFIIFMFNYIASTNIASVYIVSTNVVSTFSNVQCIIFIFNYIVSTILTRSTSSVPVHNDGFME
jgi:hypothetical protein